MSIVILGVDLGKNSCSIVGVDATGAIVTRRSMRRQTLIDYILKLPVCVVAMEACCGAHHLGRLFVARGHEVRLISPEYVRPYVKAQKNDDRDAEGIAEAASRPTTRFVDLKSEEQLDIQTLHRVRSRLVAERTNLINQLRAILLERGVIFPTAGAGSSWGWTSCLPLTAGRYRLASANSPTSFVQNGGRSTGRSRR
jgi:transposase